MSSWNGTAIADPDSSLYTIFRNRTSRFIPAYSRFVGNRLAVAISQVIFTPKRTLTYNSYAMKTRILNLCSALFITAATAMAQEAQTALVLEQTDGTKAAFLLSDNPVITITQGELTARSPKEEVTVPLDALLDYHFEKVQSGIQDVSSDEGMDLRDGTACFTGLKEGSQVIVYALDGRQIARVTVPEGGRVEVDLRTLEPGVIIISTGNCSYKVNNI